MIDDMSVVRHAGCRETERRLKQRIEVLEAELAPLEGRSVLDVLKYVDSLEQKLKALLPGGENT